MSKVIRLTGDDIEGLVRKIMSEENKVNEAWPQKELDRKATNFRRSSFNPYKREKDIKSLFGSYGEEIPPQVLQYLRKNPRLLIKRLVDIYGIDEVYNYIELATETNPVQESYEKILRENDEQLNMEFPEDESEEEKYLYRLKRYSEDYGQGYQMGEEFAEGLLEEIESIMGDEELLDTALRGFVDGFNAEMESSGIDLELSHLMKGWREGVMESYRLKDIISEKKGEKFIQKAEKKMEKKGTVGSFREYCGGEVTMACINKGLKSDDPSIVKKANYAKNIGGYKGAKRK